MMGPYLAALQTDFFGFFPIFIFFFFVVVIIIIFGMAKTFSTAGRVQRPVIDGTSFPPPPPPDTVMVRCEYCGTQQTWRQNCLRCGAPLPKPGTTGA